MWSINDVEVGVVRVGEVWRGTMERKQELMYNTQMKKVKKKKKKKKKKTQQALLSQAFKLSFYAAF